MRYFVAAILVVLACSVLAEDANAKLKKCCSKLTNEDQECVTRFCDFDSISQTNVLNYLSTCTERGSTVGKMWDCASSRVDHTKCCKVPPPFYMPPVNTSSFQDKGVEGKCLEYCSGKPSFFCCS